jgi:sugar transferase (PEP-CTERM/EpsH1 system associated)
MTGRVRVVHLVSSLGIGGLEMMVLNLVHCSNRNAFASHVICLQQTGAVAPMLEAVGVPVTNLDCSGLASARTLWRLTRCLRQLRPHVVHTHNPRPHLYGTTAALLAGVPVVLHTKHGINPLDRGLATLGIRVASRLTDFVVAVSEATAEVARRVERVPSRKLSVIRNGVDVPRFPFVACRAKTSRRVIHVARLQGSKDQTTLLRAARLVADAEPGFQLELVGDGPLRTPLTALAAGLSLGRCVRFLGFRNDVADLLSKGDLFVLSSVSEGIPLALLEAMAAGLPVVATSVGGVTEVVLPGQTGLLVPPGSPEALARAVLILLRDPATAHRMGQAGRQRIEKEFDLRHVTARYENLYLRLLGQRRAKKSLSAA